MASAAEQRTEMVARQLRRRGITDERVLEAMGAVPRELFVPKQIRDRAYADAALPIGAGQTISQPWIVAAICQALVLSGTERVLEVGGGSGYSAAVLGRLAARVVSIELVAELAAAAREALAQAPPGGGAVEVLVADGSTGSPDHAPFDAIAVHAAAPAPPRSLLHQLVPGGRLVAPVGEGDGETLMQFVRDAADDGRFSSRPIARCRFVPLLGQEGFARD